MHIVVYHNLPSGGAKRALYEWTRRLSASYKIDVCTLSTADHAFCDLRPFIQEYRVFDFTPHKLFESPLGRLNRLQRWRDLGELARIGRRIAQEINTGGYDVVFAHSCIYTFIPVFLRFVQVPSVYYLHEPFGPTFERRSRRPYLKQSAKWRELSKRLDPLVALYHRRLESARTASIERTTRMLANSQFTRQIMKLEYGVDAPVCHYGVNVEDFCPMPGVQKENCVISVGELAPRKGFDFLIESLAHIPVDKRPPLKLVSNWASSDERFYLEELAARCDVELHILVGLNTDQVALEYNKAPLCVYAPVSEPLGLVPLESMACGTPVVGVAEGGVRETIRHGETGLLTDRDPKQFADAILELLTNPLLAEELGKRGPGYVQEHWNWDDSVARLESHLRAAADGDSP